MVQMKNNRKTRLNNSGFDQLDQIGVIGIRASALGNLQDQGGVDLFGSLSDTLNDLHVVHIESTDGVAALICLGKHFLSRNKCHNSNLLLHNNVVWNIGITLTIPIVPQFSAFASITNLLSLFRVVK